MAQYEVQDLKRLSVCPILFQKEWDYSDKTKDIDDTYLYGIREVFRWFYRRNKQISPDTIVTSVAHHAFKSGLDFKQKMNLEDAFRKYTTGNFYQLMDQPFYQKEIQIFLNDRGDVLKHKVPCLVKKEKTVYFISYDLGEIDFDLFLNSYEAMFQSVWSFYVLDKVPVFINLHYNGNDIIEQRMKVNIEYIKESKRRLISLGKEINTRKTPPPSEICRNCDRRNECQIMTNIKARLLKK